MVQTKYYLIRVEWDWLRYFSPTNGRPNCDNESVREYTRNKSHAMRFRKEDIKNVVGIMQMDGVSCIEVVETSYTKRPATVYNSPNYERCWIGGRQ